MGKNKFWILLFALVVMASGINARGKSSGTATFNAHQQSMAAIAADLIEKHTGGLQANSLRKLSDQPALPVTQSDMMVRISEIEIFPEHLEAYKAILQKESSESVRIEPGVIAIYPMYQKENPNQIRILEIYANEAAYRSHLQTPHFQHYKTSTLKMVKSLKLIDMNSIDGQTMHMIFKKLGE